MSEHTALNQYDIMWLFVLFDLPTETKRQRKQATQFRKGLLLDGFSMFQFSVYLRHCASRENATVHIQRVRKIVPPEGMVSILSVTDKQFGQMIICYGKREKPPSPPPLQLELF